VGQEVDQLVDTAKGRAVLHKLVALEVQEFEASVSSQGSTERVGAQVAEVVAL